MNGNLTQYIEERWLCPEKVVEYLSEQGAISDNVIEVTDIGNGESCIKILEALDNLDFLC